MEVCCTREESSSNLSNSGSSSSSNSSSNSSSSSIASGSSTLSPASSSSNLSASGGPSKGANPPPLNRGSSNVGKQEPPELARGNSGISLPANPPQDEQKQESKAMNGLEGFLQKSSGVRSVPGGFQKRWFVLTPDLLCYFKTKDTSKASGVIDLAKVEEVAVYEDPKKKGSSNIFFVRVPGRTYFLMADSVEKRDEWIAAIRSKMNGGSQEQQGGAEQEEVVEGAEKFLSSIPYDPAGFLQVENFEEVLSIKLRANPVRCFKMFFSDESKPFLMSYHQGRRGDSEIAFGDWAPNDKLGHTREFNYRTPVKAAIGPNSTMVNEKHRYNLQPNKLIYEYVNTMKDIPYSDSFQVEGRWEITSIGPNHSQVVAKCNCFFLKKVFGMIKNQIVGGTLKETKASYGEWAQLAQEEIKKLPRKGIVIEEEEEPVAAPSSKDVTQASGMPLTKKLLFILLPLLIVILALLWVFVF